MAPRWVLASLVGVALAATASPARAETRRIAIVVGSNRGDAGHAPLRYAEQDALKMSAVLAELGGLAPEDVLLLRAPALADVRGALTEAARRVARWRAERRGQAVVLFYFSGHSDGQVLELAGAGLPFSELRQRLDAAGADVRLVIIDSCRSGALLARKGGTLGEAFDIRLADDIGSTGEALIASSAADEAALESSEIEASFFSHHLVSGLRGAADLSGDGLVTLAEAYQYAFARTLRSTSDTIAGPQHAAYDYHLAGRGDLVLTELRKPSAVLDLPRGFDRLLLVATAGEQVVAEIGARSAHRIAVAAGAYQLRAWRGTQAFGARLQLGEGQERRVTAEELVPAPGRGRDGVAKGDGGGPQAVAAVLVPAPERAAAGAWAVAAAVGVSDGVADGAWLGVVRVGVGARARRLGEPRLALSLLAGTGTAPGMRENRLGAELGASWWTGGRRLHVGAGVGAGAGVALERTDAATVHWSGLGWASALAGIELRLDDHLALALEGELPVTWLRRDDRVTVTVLPVAWLGLSRRF